MVKISLFMFSLLFFLSMFVVPTSGSAGEIEDIIALRKKAVAAYNACKNKKRVSTCKKALRYYKKALKKIGSKPAINSRIKELKIIIKSIKPKAYKPKYKNLINAARMGYTRDVSFYLKHGANVNSKDNMGRTALHYAAQLGIAGMSVMKMLLNANADPNNQDDNGLTPLHLAAMSGYAPTVKVLLKANADPTINTDDNKTPYDMAMGQAKKMLSVNLIIHCLPDTMLKVDGKVMGFTDDSGNIVIHLGPGRYKLVLKKHGFVTFKKSVDLGWGNLSFNVQLKPVPKPVVVSKPKPKPKSVVITPKPKPVQTRSKPVVHSMLTTKAPASKYSTMYKWGIVSVISGALILSLGGGMTGLALYTKNGLTKAKNTEYLNSKYSNINTYNAVAVTSYVLGGAILSTGIYLLIKGKSNNKASRVSALIGFNSIGVIVRY